jgi:hypothetical protein
MKIDEKDDVVNVYVRQSWLNDAMICPERSRLAIMLPTWRSSSDATVLGTAVHTAIEKILTGTTDVVYMNEEFVLALDDLVKEEPFKFNSMSGVNEMREFGLLMVDSFKRDILPSVELGGRVEHTFTHELSTLDGVLQHNGKPVKILFNGTMDYVTPSGVIWDWKTAARKYSQNDKQKQSIQASVYAHAVVKEGWSDYPVQFNYGVMTRTSKSVGQIVKVVRTQAHAQWIQRQVENIVTQGLRTSVDMPWLANDQNNLCSSKWCSFWSICKGAHVSEQDNTPQEENNG